jgi:hypothetical protein
VLNSNLTLIAKWELISGAMSARISSGFLLFFMINFEARQEIPIRN